MKFILIWPVIFRCKNLAHMVLGNELSQELCLVPTNNNMLNAAISSFCYDLV